MIEKKRNPIGSQFFVLTTLVLFLFINLFIPDMKLMNFLLPILLATIGLDLYLNTRQENKIDTKLILLLLMVMFIATYCSYIIKSI